MPKMIDLMLILPILSYFYMLPILTSNPRVQVNIIGTVTAQLSNPGEFEFEMNIRVDHNLLFLYVTAFPLFFIPVLVGRNLS